MRELFDSLLRGLGQALAFFYDLIPSYGVAIILLTVAVRLAMLPLTMKQMRSMQAMQKLQPELKRLQAKHKGDRQKLNEEMMKLYREQNVNPLGGCLPLILQLPVFFALYQLFTKCGTAVRRGRPCPPNFIGVAYLPQGSGLANAIVAGNAGFLGMNLGLTPSQGIKAEGLGLGIPYILVVILMAVTTWYQQKQVSSTQSSEQIAQTKILMKFMPVMLAVFSINLPAGVTIYWVASNLWTIGQQYLLLGRKAPALAEGISEAAAPAQKKKEAARREVGDGTRRENAGGPGKRAGRGAAGKEVPPAKGKGGLAGGDKPAKKPAARASRDGSGTRPGRTGRSAGSKSGGRRKRKR